MNEDILLQVRKPGQYIGEEWNVSRKDLDKARIKFALCFPDLYEVGMSNLGVRILYGILNNLEDTACERFFAPDIDMEEVLRRNSLEIFSLESKKGLSAFDIAGFSLSSELNYTNVLNILELGNIPLRSSSRGPGHPLVIGGGPCTLNPEPLHEFFDLFLIGEAEEAILELIATYRQHQQDYKLLKIDKQELLSSFSRIEGVYAPSLYEVNYLPSGGMSEFKTKIDGIPPRVKKRFVKDLNSSFYPVKWLVPNVQVIHDRANLEIMRGCPNRCRFCQAAVCYSPLRMRDKENIQEKASQIYAHTGYDEVSLTGLSVSEYLNVEELLDGLVDSFKPKAVSVSLPSVKAKASVGSMSSMIASIRKTGLTFAPEAGSERLRKVLGKDFNEQEFFASLEQSYLSGYRRVKLYFMIGLPFETQSDLDGIIDFSLRASQLKAKTGGPPAEVNISINTLIPKPHTPLEWFGMPDLESIKQKQEYLRSVLKKHPSGRTRRMRLKLNFHDHRMSFLEGVLSRGDRKLSEVIFCAYKKGVRLDAWGNHFNFEKWQEAFLESGVDPYFYLKPREADSLFPWDFLDVAISKHALREEFDKLIDMQ